MINATDTSSAQASAAIATAAQSSRGAASTNAAGAEDRFLKLLVASSATRIR